jgi:hypothetical protein
MRFLYPKCTQARLWRLHNAPILVHMSGSIENKNEDKNQVHRMISAE